MRQTKPDVDTDHRAKKPAWAFAVRAAAVFLALVFIGIAAFAAYIIVPLLFMPDPPRAVYPADFGKRIAVIDPGHGGDNEGAKAPWGELEKNRNLRIARVLKRRLEASGRWTVLLTRDSDVNIPNSRRPEIANEARADLYISLHCNASPRKLRGFALIWYAAQRDARSRDLAVRIAGKMREAGFRPDMGMGPRYKGPRPPEKSPLYQLTDGDLPVYVSEKLDRKMIYPANMPAVLFETHYLSNLTEALRFAAGLPVKRLCAVLEAALADFIAHPPPNIGEGECGLFDGV